jgi:hypothetical protein
MSNIRFRCFLKSQLRIKTPSLILSALVARGWRKGILGSVFVRCLSGILFGVRSARGSDHSTAGSANEDRALWGILCPNPPAMPLDNALADGKFESGF